MRLDVILPTYNRHQLLGLALESLLAAETSPELDVTVTVVDNNSSDATGETVERYRSKFKRQLQYVFEKKQGRSHALNAGINATDGELVGMIDDDEQIDPSWFRHVYEMFSTGEVDFIGGPYLPSWGGEPPAWLPRNNPGVLGIVSAGSQHAFGTSQAQLMGGNAVISRAALRKVGLYSTDLGRKGKLPLADEDTDMYWRLLAGGARGMYVPDLIIYHYIHPDRLTKRYFRSWHFWRGVSSGLLDRRRPQSVPYFLGVPRYLFGRATRGSLRMLKRLAQLRRDPSEMFADELMLVDLAGFFYGRRLYKPSDGSSGEISGNELDVSAARTLKKSRQRRFRKPPK